MEKEMDFYIYLMEKYAVYKNISTTDVVNKLEELKLTNLVYDMYEKYHTESIENAFKDIDDLINSKVKENS